MYKNNKFEIKVDLLIIAIICIWAIFIQLHLDAKKKCCLNLGWEGGEEAISRLYYIEDDKILNQPGKYSIEGLIGRIENINNWEYKEVTESLKQIIVCGLVIEEKYHFKILFRYDSDISQDLKKVTLDGKEWYYCPETVTVFPRHLRQIKDINPGPFRRKR